VSYLGKNHDQLSIVAATLAFTHNLLNGTALTDPLTELCVVRAGILSGWK